MGSVLLFVGGFLLVVAFMGGWVGVLARHFAKKTGAKDPWMRVMILVQVFTLSVLAVVSTLSWRSAGLTDFVQGVLFGTPTIVLWGIVWWWHYKQRRR